DANNDVMMWLNFQSSTMDNLELTDYAERYLVDRFSVVDGVARVQVGGARRYSMRVWLHADALAARALTVADVEAALRRENVELPAGRIESVDREFTVRVARSYRAPEDFRGLALKRGEGGYIVRLGEVADVEFSAEDERSVLRGNGESMVGIGIIQQSTANAIAVADGVREVAKQVAEQLPDGTVLAPSYDTSVFIRAAIREVYVSFFIAVVLVIAVIYLFLGNLRATLIPAVAVPVSLTAALIVLNVLGYSINLFTLLALILAIGMVVDDAIVVLENIHRRMELGEPAMLAAFRGTRQVGFAVVATTAVLFAVFIPIAFLTGNIGRLFVEFAFAMSAAIGFSGLVALTITPVMASRLLKPNTQGNWLTRRIDRDFERLQRAYRRLLESALRRRGLVLLAGASTLGLIAWFMSVIPSELAPTEDRGAFIVVAKAPEGASFDYSMRMMTKVENILLPLLESGEVTRVLTRVPGGFGSTAVVNSGFGVVVMSLWEDRERSTQDVMAEITPKLGALTEGLAFPAMRQGLVRRGGFQPVQFVVGGSTYEEIARYRDILLDAARRNPGLSGVDADYKETKPQLLVDIDRDRAADLGVSLGDVGRTLETLLGTRRVTTMIERGEEYNVILAARDEDRASPADIFNNYVRSLTTGKLIPLSNLVRVRELAGAAELNRFNRFRAVTISANLNPGYTLGEALAFFEGVARDKLPATAAIDYKGESREFKESSRSLYFVFGLALVVVFLVLAAQFESFVHPFVIMLTVPLAVAGALGGLWIAGSTLNIYSQIGIVMLIGLAAKNGILIVEFANQLRDEGAEFTEALLRASALRLRPILMTALSTAVGAVPLVIAHGAGAGSRRTIGVVVFFGIMFASALTLVVIPVLYDLLARNTGSPGEAAARLAKLHEETPDNVG
ncbi:MAG: efflux RND transporter permease subunit, partial [Deltaproteobacteria bacterium]|nr:efflux RND transporter permease subunit [Deltaproteobacteria bacterium]